MITFEYRGPYFENFLESEYGYHIVDPDTPRVSNNYHRTSFSDQEIKIDSDIIEYNVTLPTKKIIVFVDSSIYNNTDFNKLSDTINLYFDKCHSPIEVIFSTKKQEAHFQLEWIEGTDDESYAHGTVTYVDGDIPIVRVPEIVFYNMLPVVLLHEIGNLFGLSDRVECSKNLMAKKTFNNTIRLTPAQILAIIKGSEASPIANLVPDLNIFPLV